MLGSQPITGNVVAPGYVATETTWVRAGERISWIPSRCAGTQLLRRPPRRWPYLTSAVYITGEVLPVDGGLGMGY